MSEIREHYSLLPENASRTERAFERAFGDLLEAIDAPFPELLDPQRTPAAFLPYLAADRGVHEWSATAPDSEKRATIAAAWPTKRLAGTRRALQMAVRSLGLEPEVIAWHRLNPKGDPYTLHVVAVNRNPLDADTQERLQRRLEAAKAERDVLTLEIVGETRGWAYIGAVTYDGDVTYVYPYAAEDTEVTGPFFIGLGLDVVDDATVYPLPQ
ncbi:phage tail protein I [Spirulina subsalsa FACHB-351]|uniref:Phage tail protein I n=1 Tax=Spirulina subsalsa FACHB-351 TaxID=234711 RepID=A0ABT3L5R6_9CYAN|nr:phage tail protein I [Spirulina subsalsa]MCW6036825.1 phage tail protein I [Spirulina subsalsa FACHB-351]